MRHHVIARRFGRTSSHRQAMFRNLTTSLFMRERILTTVMKAKDLRRVAEKLITLARGDSLAARRRAYSYLRDKAVVHKLFAEIGPRYRSRPGGYTRIIRTDVRPGDAAERAVIELINDGTAVSKGASGKKAKGNKKAGTKHEKAHEAAPQVEAEGKKEEKKSKAPTKKGAAAKDVAEKAEDKEAKAAPAKKSARKKKEE